MNLTAAIHGFYAVLDRDDEALARVLVAHARVLQVRIKPAVPPTTAELVAVARMARRVTRDAGAALVIDDRLDVALAVEADAVHLGQTDLPLADARRARGGMPIWIGVSTHDLDQVEAAVAGGADYLGFGPVFATTTKANPDPVRGLERLADAVRAAGQTPVVAIGGITPEVARDVARAGAAAACVISGVNAASDPAEAARTVAAAWRK